MTRRDMRLALGILVAALLLLGALALSAFFGPEENRPTSAPVAVFVPSRSIGAEPSRQAKGPQRPDADRAAARPSRGKIPVETRPSALVAPADEPAPKPQPAPKEVHAGDVTTLNNPTGEYKVGDLDAGKVIKLQGKVGVLRLDHCNGGHLDARGLHAREIIIAGALSGDYVVLLSAPGGVVEMNGEIEGKGTFYVAAPAGKVRLHGAISGEGEILLDCPGGEVWLSRLGETAIQGQPRLTVTARDFAIHGDVKGSSQIHVTLTAPGSLQFARLQGGTRMSYRQARVADPAPKILPGDVRGSADFKKLDP